MASVMVDKETKEARGSSTALLSEDEQNSLLNIWKATMDPWRDMRSTMPLQYLYTFALVATHEGLGVQEYADLAGVAQTVMSRHLLDLGSRNRHMEEGFKLVFHYRC
jgi:hypothetical protein